MYRTVYRLASADYSNAVIPDWDRRSSHQVVQGVFMLVHGSQRRPFHRNTLVLWQYGRLYRTIPAITNN